jgi:acetyl-CoA carboxylase carboxyltransferase component
MSHDIRPELLALKTRLSRTLDEGRPEAAAKRHALGYRTARENLADLIDEGSFTEYGQLAIAAQRSRREVEDLQTSTAADGVITGVATINREQFGPEKSRAAVVVYDFSVLAGTQGYFHHQKLDRIFEVAEDWKLPVIMYTEGGGGRPGDTDVTTLIAGLNVRSFTAWARLSGLAPRISINNGYCFAGNAVLFGCADITIATRTSWIGMAGPAMIQGGGLGVFKPTEIGPIEVQEKNGTVDIVADNEAEATAIARKLLGYFQGPLDTWSCADQTLLRDIVPGNRRRAYQVRRVITTLADDNSFIELRREYGKGLVTGFIRLGGKPVGLMANDCLHLAGAVDAESAQKGARFLQLCDAYEIPILSLMDTPGFMVGPESEAQSAVRRMSSLVVTGASVTVPIVTIVLRRGYGLGAQAMTGGSFVAPVYIASWPTGEFGGMGLEGAVWLGFKKELEAVADEAERQELFDTLLAKLYEKGRATEAATYLEIDAVIDPAETREVILKVLAAAPKPKPPHHKRRNFIDTW